MSRSAAEMAASKARAARAREYNTNSKPDFTLLLLDDPAYDSRFGAALNWLTVEFGHGDMKDITIEWAEQKGLDAESLSKIPDFEFSSVGKSVYIINAGGQLSERSIAKMNETIRVLSARGKAIAEKENKKSTVKKFIKIPGHILADEVQDMIILSAADDQALSDIIFDSKLAHNDVNDFINRIRAFLSDWESEDSQCVEMRELMGEEKSTYNRDKYRIALKIAEMLTENIKAERKATKKATGFAAQRAERTVKNIKTKKIDMEYNIVSLPPEEIVGSRVLLTFNTKNRRLGYYVAKEGETLSVKGTTILNFDEEKSFAKIVRNTDKDLAPFRSAKNERRVEVLITENIKGVVHKMNGRVNSDTVILKVFK